MNEIPRREILRYLGIRDRSFHSEDPLIDKCADTLFNTCHPMSVSRTFPLFWKDGFPVVEGTVLESRNLSRNLKGCEEVILMACTLGLEADRLIHRAEIRSMAEASILQACGAAMIEAYCDEINQSLIDDARKRGMYARPRYSPGYGDLDLSYQTLVFRLLDPLKNIRVSLNDQFLMVPTKSVTAFIGLSSHEEPCILQGCEVCDRQTSCAYSRKGDL